MHECSVTEQLVKIALRHADESGTKKVIVVNLVVGEITGYMEESLAFYYRILTRNTKLEGSELRVSFIKTLLNCVSCKKDFERARFSFDCPVCGTPGTMTKIGSEFYIDSIEVEE